MLAPPVARAEFSPPAGRAIDRGRAGPSSPQPVKDVPGDPIDEPVPVDQAGHPLAGTRVEHRAAAPGEAGHHPGPVAGPRAVSVALRAQFLGQVGESAERPGWVSERDGALEAVLL